MTWAGLLRDAQRLLAGPPVPAPRVTFLCFAKEKSPKERRPGSLAARKQPRAVPCAPRLPGTLANSPAAQNAARARPALAYYSRVSSGARRVTRDPTTTTTTTRCRHRVEFAVGVPYGAPGPSAPSAASPLGGREWIRVRRHPVQGCAVWRPQKRGSLGRGFSRHRGGLSFWLLFLWPSKEKVTLGAGAEHPLVPFNRGTKPPDVER